jgi:hypothetical protein
MMLRCGPVARRVAGGGLVSAIDFLPCCWPDNLGLRRGPKSDEHIRAGSFGSDIRIGRK